MIRTSLGETVWHDASQECAVQSNVSKQVIINGVIGWGVDSAPDIDAAFQALHTVLKRR